MSKRRQQASDDHLDIFRASIEKNRALWADRLGISLPNTYQLTTGVNGPGPEVLDRFIQTVSEDHEVSPEIKDWARRIRDVPARFVFRRLDRFSGSVDDYIFEARYKKAGDGLRALPRQVRTSVLEINEIVALAPEMTSKFAAALKAAVGWFRSLSRDGSAEPLERELGNAIRSLKGDGQGIRDQLLAALQTTLSSCDSWVRLGDKPRKMSQAEVVLGNFQDLRRQPNASQLGWVTISYGMLRGLDPTLQRCDGLPQRLLQALAQVKVAGRTEFPEADKYLQILMEPKSHFTLLNPPSGASAAMLMRA